MAIFPWLCVTHDSNASVCELAEKVGHVRFHVIATVRHDHEKILVTTGEACPKISRRLSAVSIKGGHSLSLSHSKAYHGHTHRHETVPPLFSIERSLALALMCVVFAMRTGKSQTLQSRRKTNLEVCSAQSRVVVSTAPCYGTADRNRPKRRSHVLHISSCGNFRMSKRPNGLSLSNCSYYNCPKKTCQNGDDTDCRAFRVFLAFLVFFRGKRR